MTKKTQQTRTKEDQWRRRVAAQGLATTPTLSGTGSTTTAAATTALDDGTDGDAGYTQAEMRQMPSVATTSAGAATKSTGTSANPRTTTVSTAGAANAATQRRALAASRAARSRMAVNTMSLEEEMGYVRSDVRSLIVLTAICLAVIIVLSFLIR